MVRSRHQNCGNVPVFWDFPPMHQGPIRRGLQGGMPVSRLYWVAGANGWKVLPRAWLSVSTMLARTRAVAASAPVRSPAAPVALEALAAATKAGRLPVAEGGVVER
eukprot:3942392-Prorocentrum_lima.AAC.1